MPIPPKKEEEYKQPDIISWQSFVFLGLIATAATGLMISKGGFKMNRNLNVMQRFVTTHSDKLDKFVEHTPSGKDKLFRENVQDIIKTAQNIAEDKIPEKKDMDKRHIYPKPTFPSTTNFHRSRQLLSSKRKEDDDNSNNDQDK